MRVADAALDELIELYKDEFGEEISRADAREMAFRLITLYDALAKRLPSDAQVSMPPLDSPGNPIGFRM